LVIAQTILPGQGPDSLSNDGHYGTEKDIEKLAYQEGHDADIPTNEGTVAQPAILNGELAKDVGSSTTRDVDADADVENGETHNGTSNGSGNSNGTQITDKDVVWWEEPADRDPANPLTWSAKKKWGNIAVLSGLTFVT
jgi:hypothetical protein